MAHSFGDLNHVSPAEIVLPINFDEAVNWDNKTDLNIKKMAGDDLDHLEFFIRGEGAAYEAVFLPAPNTSGGFIVSFSGEVIITSSGVRETVNITPVLVPYSNLPVLIKDLSTPVKLSDGYWAVLIEFEYPVSGFSVQHLSEYFVTGIDDTDSLWYYALTLDVKPDPPPAFSRAYPINETSPQHCVGDWQYVGFSFLTGIQAKYFYVKWKTDTDEVPNLAIVPRTVLPPNQDIQPVSLA